MTRHLEADSLVPILDENRKQSIIGTVSAILHVVKKKKKEIEAAVPFVYVVVL